MGRVSDYVPCSVTHSLRVKSVPVVIERRRVVATGVSPCAVGAARARRREGLLNLSYCTVTITEGWLAPSFHEAGRERALLWCSRCARHV